MSEDKVLVQFSAENLDMWGLGIPGSLDQTWQLLDFGFDIGTPHADFAGFLAFDYQAAANLGLAAHLKYNLGAINLGYGVDVTVPTQALYLNSGVNLDTGNWSVNGGTVQTFGPDPANSEFQLSLSYGAYAAITDVSIGIAGWELAQWPGVELIDIPDASINLIDIQGSDYIPGDPPALEFPGFSGGLSFPQAILTSGSAGSSSDFAAIQTSGVSNSVLSASLDLDTAVAAMLNLLVPGIDPQILGKSQTLFTDAGGGHLDFSYDIFDAGLGLTVQIGQQFTFTPTDVEVRLETSLGQVIEGSIGDNFAIETPDAGFGTIDVAVQYILHGTLRNETGLIFTGSFDFSALSVSFDNTIITPLSASLGPLWTYSQSWSSEQVNIFDQTFAVQIASAPIQYSLDWENFYVGTDGDDVLPMTPHQVSIDAMGGDDDVTGNSLDNTIHGGSGDDLVTAGLGADTIYGDADNDVLAGDGGDDIIEGGDGDDSLSGGADADDLDGGDGADQLLGEGGDDTLSGGGGEDLIDGGADDDTAHGGDNGDVLLGGAGDDVLDGEAGDDTVEGGVGNDQLQGGTGSDTAVYLNASAGAIVNLSGQTVDFNGRIVAAGQARDGDGGIDALSGFESVVGSDFRDALYASGAGSTLLGGKGADFIAGNSGQDALDGGQDNDELRGGDEADILLGGEGSDKLFGESHDDLLAGGAGADTLDGGAGNADYASYLDDAAGVTVNLGDQGFQLSRVGAPAAIFAAQKAKDGSGALDKLYGIEGVIGSAHADILIGSANSDTLVGKSGSDVLHGNGGGDVLAGGTGDDTYYVMSFDDIVDDDRVDLGGGTDRIITALDHYSLGASADRSDIEQLELRGTARHGTGNALSNLIIGTAGHDVLDGAQGADQLDGGAGNDTYIFDHAGDYVTEAPNAGVDEIQLHTASFNEGHDFDLKASWALNVENVVLLDDAKTIDILGNGLNNFISDNGRSNFLDGDEGDDSIRVGGGSDTVAGGAGTDRLIVDYSWATERVFYEDYFGARFRADSNTFKVDFSSIERFDVRTGTGNDFIVTAGLDDKVSSGGGNDHIVTLAGKAVIDGAAGVDRWDADYSGATAAVSIDLVANLNTAQTFLTDSSVKGIEALTLRTGSQNDTIVTLTGPGTYDDTIIVNDGDDTVKVGGGNDSVAGGSGTDLLIVDYSWATERVYYEDYFGQRLRADSNTFKVDYSGIERFDVKTGTGHDYVLTGGLDDRVSSGDGNDHIVTFTGRAVIDGGAGIDLWDADYSDATAAVTINLVANLAAAQTFLTDSSVKGIEALTLRTGSQNDTITTLTGFGTYNDWLSTDDGDDTVKVGGGNDTVLGGSGTDRLIVDYSWATERVYYEDYFGQRLRADSNTFKVDYGSIERFDVKTGTGNDFIVTGGLDDVVSTGAGDDHMVTFTGRAVIDGGAGIDLWDADYSGATAAVAINLVANLQTAQTFLTDSSVKGIERLTLSTGSADDSIVTLTGLGTYNDTIITNDGDDTVKVGGGSDAVAGGAGTDLLIVDYSWATERVYFENYFGARFRADSNTFKVDFSGIDRFDIKTGAGNDYLETGLLDDIVSTGAGDDHMVTFTGRAVVDGGAGIDWWNADYSGATAAVAIDLVANLKTAQMFLTDSSVKGIERLTLSSGSADDSIVTLTGPGTHNDTITTNDGDDTVKVGGGNDSVAGGAGTDLLIVDYSWATERVYYENYFGTRFRADSNTFNVDFSGVDRFDVKTGAGNDYLVTGGLDDIVSTGAGDDHMITFAGRAVIDGGAGADWWDADYSGATAAITIDLNLKAAQTFLTDSSVKGIERLTLSTGSGDDTIVTLTGPGTYSDTVITNDGDDTIEVGGGQDAVNGGSGTDLLIVDYSWATERVYFENYFGTHFRADSNTFRVDFSEVERFDVKTGTGHDYLETGALDDRIATGGGNDTVHGWGGDDLIQGGEGFDALYGGDGNDRLHGGLDADAMHGGAGNDIYVVDDAADTVHEAAAQGYDIVRTSVDFALQSGVEVEVLRSVANLGVHLTGNELKNIVTGGEGDDVISGGGGDDVLSGGLGADQFRFEALPGMATVKDFEQGADSLGIVAAQFGHGLAAGGDVDVVNVDSRDNATHSDAGGYFIFDTAGPQAHTLFWDATGGSGDDAVAIARLNNVSSLTASDFNII